MDDISHHDEFDYVVVNNDFDEAVEKLAGIIDTERRGKKARSECVTALVESLLR